MDANKAALLGLSKNESIIFSNLINMHPLTAGELIRKTGLHRNIVYDIISKLENKGFVFTVIKKNKRYYYIADEKFFNNFINKEEKKIIEKKRIIKGLLSELKQYENIDLNAQINVINGKNGLKILSDDLLNEKKNYLIFGASEKILDALPKYYWKNFAIKRQKIKIKTRLIASHKLRWWVEKELDEQYNEARYLKKFETSTCETVIWGNKVAIVFLSPEIKIIIIEDKSLSENYTEIFELLWETAEK